MSKLKDDDMLAPVSPINGDADAGWFDGRPVTMLYDETDLSTLLPPDTIMQQRYPDHPAFRTQAAKRESRYSAIDEDLSNLTGPEVSFAKRQPSVSKSGHRNASPRANASPDMTKSMVAHDLGNPYNHATAPSVPPLPDVAARPVTAKDTIGVGKERQRAGSKSAMRAVHAQKVSPLSKLSELTAENLARQHGVPTANQGQATDMVSDVTRDTKFYEFYPGVLESPAPRVKEGPGKKPGVEVAKGRK